MMRMLRLRFARRLARLIGARDDDSGMALATVIIFGAVLILMSATVVSVSVSGNTRAQSDSNWTAAGQAAYAGVEDYQSKLANDNSYSQYGTLGTTFSAGSTFTGTNSNPAFGLGTTGTWATVDASVTNGATFRYQVNNSQYSAHGILQLQSTGRVGNTTRTVVANLKQSGFLNYLYFTDYEIADPSLTTGCAPADGSAVPYQWQGGRSSKCTTIQFASGDVLSGPVHSNDTMYICGSTFKNTVDTSSTATGRYILPSGCSTPNFAVTGSPAYTPLIQMPSTIGSLVQETRSDLTSSTVPRPGCLYTGPTTFTFNGDGTMTVYSPWSQYTNITGSPATAGNNLNSACGVPGSTTGTLGGVGGETIPTVPNNLIYVQNVPTSTTDPNYPSKSWSTGYPPKETCKGADGTTTGNGVGYPAVNETAPSSTSYGCKNGDAFVTDHYTNGVDDGGFGGNMTIAANNYMYISGDVTYDNPSTDLLGLIGENNVIVYNPIGTYTTYTTQTTQTPYTYSCPTYYNPFKTCTGYNTTTSQVPTTHTNVLLDETQSDRTIDAALMSVLHSFTVQNYSADSGNPKGNLNVLGAIVQKYRGAVATASGSGSVATGYTKNYLYDPRLAYEAPPKFLSPVSTTYGITSVTETKTAMNAAGANL